MQTKKLGAQIRELAKRKNAIILAHYYQEHEIQDIADFVGDSLALAQYAQKTDAKIIVLAGVYFMAETAKILNPNSKVLVPDRAASCSLVEGCPPDEFSGFVAQHPGYKVVTYINSSLEVKAMSDLICTSSNARAIIDSIPEKEKIIFAPDAHLGAWLIKETGREMVLWKGECAVHQAFAKEKLLQLFQQHPNAELIAHPESHENILRLASFIGSTTALINRVASSPNQKFLIGTEAGVLHKMRELAPEKTLIPLPSMEDNSCACSECAYMKLNTMEKLYYCLEKETPEVTVEPTLAERALVPLQRMLQLSESIKSQTPANCEIN